MSGRRATCLLVLPLVLCAGCVSSWWNAWLDPTQVGNFRHNVVNEIQETISFRDKPGGIPNAVDPTPDDLVPWVEEYVIGPGDVIRLRLLDFVGKDMESDYTITVDEPGYIQVPQLGLIRVEGLSPTELRTEIIQRAQDASIYRRDIDPTVIITMEGRQHRLFNISGAPTNPGPLPIPRPDFRLNEAINYAGGLDDQAKVIWVIRSANRERRGLERPASAPAGQRPSSRPAPPVTPDAALMSVAGGPAPAADAASQAPQPTRRGREAPAPARASEPESGLALPADQAERDLIDAVAPVPAPTSAQATEASQPATPSSEPTLPPFIFVNDKFIEQPARAPERPGPPERPGRSEQPIATRQGEPATEPAGKPVDWQELAEEDQQRIIRIPAERLRNGDSSYNIVVRHQDWIRIDPGPVGYFYMGGHVVRPGTYTLNGQELTLTQAIFAAGGLDPLAWPTRCEIRRRIDHDREEITQWDLARIIEGQDPDLFIKPDDVVNIGTHAIAPFLATVRNSFRLAYGFGFVYDRNFADIDAIYGSANPRERRRTELQQRFPGLFPSQ